MRNPQWATCPTVLSLLFASLFGLIAGCGGKKKLTVHTVKGVVKYNGKPMVGGGSILFLPTKGGSGKEASGVIDRDGKFQLTTYEQNDGAPAGEYKVVIRQTTVEEPEGGSDDGRAPESAKSIPKADQIPLIYANPLQTPLSETIPEGGKELTIEIQPQAAKTKKGA